MTPDDARRLAAALAGTDDRSSDARLVFEIGGKGYAWSFMERVHPKKPRVPRPDILAVRCDPARKDLLLEAAPDRFFTDDHYRGYPAVLVRLDVVEEAELASLLEEGWRIVGAGKRTKRNI